MSISSKHIITHVDLCTCAMVSITNNNGHRREHHARTVDFGNPIRKSREEEKSNISPAYQITTSYATN